MISKNDSDANLLSRLNKYSISVCTVYETLADFGGIIFFKNGKYFLPSMKKVQKFKRFLTINGTGTCLGSIVKQQKE